MSARPTTSVRGRPGPVRPTARPDRRPAYRLLHSSGDHLIHDRATALQHLARLPGAKLFVLAAPAGAGQQGKKRLREGSPSRAHPVLSGRAGPGAGASGWRGRQ